MLQLEQLQGYESRMTTHRAIVLFSDCDVLDSIVLDGEFTLGGEPNGLLVGAAAPAPFFGLSSESE